MALDDETKIKLLADVEHRKREHENKWNRFKAILLSLNLNETMTMALAEASADYALSMVELFAARSNASFAKIVEEQEKLLSERPS